VRRHEATGSIIRPLDFAPLASGELFLRRSPKAMRLASRDEITAAEMTPPTR